MDGPRTIVVGKLEEGALVFARAFLALPNLWRLEFIRELEFKADHDEKVIHYMEADERPKARAEVANLRALAQALLELHNTEGPG